MPLQFSSNNPKLTVSPIEEDVDENGIRRRAQLVPGPRTYSEVTVKGEETLVQIGGNDLSSPPGEPLLPVDIIAKDVIKAGETCKYHGVENVFISGVPIRSRRYVQKRVHELNGILQDMCVQKGFMYIDNSNINTTHLLDDGVHLSYDGTIVLANNYLNCLNSLYWERISKNLPHD